MKGYPIPTLQIHGPVRLRLARFNSYTFAKNLLSSALASFSLRRRLPFWQISGDFRVKNGGILGAFRGMKMGGFGAVLRWSCS